MKPNFLVIGAPKAATTSLCHQLAQHPEVFFSVPKETFFFCYDDRYASRGWDWFESLFDGAEGYKAIGEGSTINANLGTYPNALPRIVEHLPDTKIIYIVREPIQRMESYWIELHSQGSVTAPFNKAVREDPQFLDTSLYWKQLSAYREHFADDKILLLFFEDFKKDAHAVLAQCFAFLGVDASVRIEDAQKPRYTSDNKRSDYAVTNLLRKTVPGFYKLRDKMPKPLRETAKKLLKKPIEGRPEWDADTLAWAVDQVRADSAKFLEHCGKPADYWDLGKYGATDRIKVPDTFS